MDTTLLYIFKDNQIKKEILENNNKDVQCAGIFPIDKMASVFQNYNISQTLILEFMKSNHSKFESYVGFDIISLNILDDEKGEITNNKIFIYITTTKIFIFCNNQEVKNIVSGYIEGEKEIASDKIMYHLFKKISFGDEEMLQRMEEEIDTLEDNLLYNNKSDYIKDIVEYRHKLLSLKNYYHQFYDILEGIQENENDVIQKSTLKYFKMLSGRIDRLDDHTTFLREYISQVREEYQEQVEIELNKIMKFFTVITAIFLPLTLIAGWYGMNLQMPEYKFLYSYPIVVFGCLIVIAFSITYFKKHKWF